MVLTLGTEVPSTPADGLVNTIWVPSIVKHGAQVHHAQIAMQSALGEGTTITLTFPAQSSGKK